MIFEVITLTDLMVLAVLLLAIGGAAVYIIREKKKGARCIGCPHAGECAARRKGGCGTKDAE